MGLCKIADVVVYRDDGYYCGPGPSVVVFPDGEVTAFFRRHRSWPVTPLLLHAHPMTEQCRVGSYDGGATWETTPRVFAAGGNCPCVTLLADGALLLARHRMEAVLKCLLEGDTQAYEADRHKGDWQLVFAGLEVWRSDDMGEHWQGPFWVDDVPGLEPAEEGLHPPLGIRGFPVELRDGSIALPLYAEGEELVLRDDGGDSDLGYPHAALLPDGRALVVYYFCDAPDGQRYIGASIVEER